MSCSSQRTRIHRGWWTPRCIAAWRAHNWYPSQDNRLIWRAYRWGVVLPRAARRGSHAAAPPFLRRTASLPTTWRGAFCSRNHWHS